ncbi:uncharacterized protein PV09_06673 [Verruconis gallopava]|uniref:Uncharacterized protein n=1 Tax=Verruconis gallopava TaxID=253628 RepID=A0A0D1XHU4_9PEZI|nr:uncharacterized protein PV09_06673 [Verruconis gallopava]KIW01821.1 hypothetical protein PV09_06673 [Verruconis gallopava]
MESQPDPAPPARPVETDPSLRRRTSCFDVLKKFGKSAWRKFGAAAKDSRTNVPAQPQPPIQSLVVDDNEENVPPTENDPSTGNRLEVDPNETFELNFKITPFSTLPNAATRERLAVLCARYGLQYDDGTSDAPGQLRVPRKTKQRVRVSCHVCKSVFKGERVCQKCGHGKCEDCPRRSVTEPRPTPESAVVVSIDSSSDDDEQSAKGAKDAEPRPETSKPDASLPIVEFSKYTCHKCSGEFASVTNTPCSNCGHEKRSGQWATTAPSISTMQAKGTAFLPSMWYFVRAKVEDLQPVHAYSVQVLH